MTNQELIDRAMWALGVVESGDSASAADSADALVVQNSMMAAWKVSDKDLNYFPQDTLTDTVPVPDWAEEGVIANLAVKLAVPFRAPVTASLMQEATQGEELIIRTLINHNLEQADMSHLSQGFPNYGDILNG